MKEDEKFLDVDWKLLQDYLPEKLVEELDEANPRDIHQQLMPSSRRSSRASFSLETPIPIIIHRSDDEVDLPVLDVRHVPDQHEENIRHELVLRFLTAMSIDYEKQWYLGMIRRQTLNILIKSVEQAKHRRSFELHWNSIREHFRLARLLHFLLGIDSFPSLINRWLEHVFFDHIYRTIELTLSESRKRDELIDGGRETHPCPLGYHSAKTRIDNIRSQFPELSNLNERMMNELYDEVRLYQFQAEEILLDLKESYEICWKTQMTRRCAQMLLKYESVAIIQLYETGILDSKEYSHILQLIEKKLFTLEYGTIAQRRFLHVDPFDALPYFQALTDEEKGQWKTSLRSSHRWIQPKTSLIEKNQRVNTAYLIVRGIVESNDQKREIFYRSGTIIGLDCLFEGKAPSSESYSSAACLLEVYALDSPLLTRLLANEKIARLIYDQIAERRLWTNYRAEFSFTLKELQVLLAEKSLFYRTNSNLSLDLHGNHRLFLISGRVSHQEILFHSMQFHRITRPGVYQVDSSTIVYLWTSNDELDNAEPNLVNNTPRPSLHALYPHYLGDSVEFTPRRHSLSMTRPIDNISHLQFIPAEIDATSEISLSISQSDPLQTLNSSPNALAEV